MTLYAMNRINQLGSCILTRTELRIHFSLIIFDRAFAGPPIVPQFYDETSPMYDRLDKGGSATVVYEHGFP